MENKEPDSPGLLIVKESMPILPLTFKRHCLSSPIPEYSHPFDRDINSVAASLIVSCGLQWKSTIKLLSSSHKIKHKNNETAVLGENVTIFCNLTTPEDVVQITWQKIQDSLLQNIGTYSSKYGEKILPPYVDRLRCEIIEPDSSFITIHQVTFEDEACYKCLFNVFPYGSHGGLICLSIITVSELRTELRFDSVSKGFLSLINSAMGKPAPQISLFPSHVLIHPPEEYLAQHPNSTVTVTKIHTISLDAVRSLGLKHLIVYMDHPLRNEEKIVPLPVNQNCVEEALLSSLYLQPDLGHDHSGAVHSTRCSLQSSQEVLSVTWQKKKAVSPENMVTFSKNHGVVIQPAYKDRINITELGLQNSTITFWNTTLEDEGCYMCLFNTFGSGKISGTSCLTLYVLSWKVAVSGIDNSTESLLNPNGTTSVTSTLYVKDPKKQVGKEVICQVLHLGSVTNFKQTLSKGIATLHFALFLVSQLNWC
ncbi:OX-2 membrane glycoprotein [Tupaia chinensis]|uniref:OX-2 membrane glycoprotein n=1 Tax=Tupaia chinensis TaxID=246437 RepID=L9KF92_TUPCH|nr:OX-2 membrane glycoprotein [Tupaia chinensis]